MAITALSSALQGIASMRAVLKLEQIGVGCGERYQGYLGRDKSKPWVARLTGLDEQYGFKRDFMRAPCDYSRASGTGARGIYKYYALEPGIYEVNERTSWKSVRRYFIQVHDDATYTEIGHEQVMSWLQSDTSE